MFKRCSIVTMESKVCQENLGKWLFKLLLSSYQLEAFQSFSSVRTADLWIFSLFQTIIITFLPHSEAQFKFHQAVLTVSTMNVSKSKCIAVM